MTTESPLMVRNENVQKTPSSSKKGIRKNLFRSTEKPNILNESLEGKNVILISSRHLTIKLSM